MVWMVHPRQLLQMLAYRVSAAQRCKMACKLPSAELISAATCTIAEILCIICIRYEHACRPSQIGLAKQFGSLVGVALGRYMCDE